MPLSRDDPAEGLLSEALRRSSAVSAAQAQSASAGLDVQIPPPPKPVLSEAAYRAFQDAVNGNDPVEPKIKAAIDSVRSLFE